MPKTKKEKESLSQKPSLKKYHGPSSYWYGFNHKEVYKKFGGELEFVNEFCVNNEYKPVAVYRAANPDKSKGHKEFMLLQTTEHGGLVRGMTREQILPFSKQAGIWCGDCNDVIYSIMRHHMVQCNCRSVSVDGGQDYFKVSYSPPAKYAQVEIDLLTSKLKLIKTKTTKARRS